MDVHSKKIEAACKKFKEDLSFPTTITHVSFSRLNKESKSLKALCTDYEWHLNYWSQELYKLINTRITTNNNNWICLGNAHQELMLDYGINYKIDMTVKSQNIIDILSVASIKPLNKKEIDNLLSVSSKIGMLSKNIFKNFQIDDLPLTINNNPHNSEQINIKVNGVKKHLFGNVCYSEKELSTIQKLLELKSIKEIAWIHNCSLTAEKKRIDTIKKKSGCECGSLSALYKHLKLQGLVR